MSQLTEIFIYVGISVACGELINTPVVIGSTFNEACGVVILTKTLRCIISPMASIPSLQPWSLSWSSY